MYEFKKKKVWYFCVNFYIKGSHLRLTSKDHVDVFDFE